MRREFLYATSFLAGLTAFTGVAVHPAHAQQAAGGGLEEIVVTARKREENLMTVPLSVSAVTAQDIQNRGITDARDLAPYTPGLWVEYSVSSTNGRTMSFRGDSADPGLIFIDGAPYGGQANPDLSSLERVEVLVGPQSAYFGRSTFTGAVNYITKDPGDKFAGTVRAGVSSFGSTDDYIALEGPISDKFAIRITGSHVYNGGQWTNGSDPNDKLGWTQKDAGTIVAVFKPNDDWKIKAFFQYAVDNDGTVPTIALSGWGSNPSVPNVPGYQSRQLFCNLGGSFGSWWCGKLPSAKALAGMNTPGTANIISADDTISPLEYNVLINNAYHLEPNEFNPTWLTHSGTKILTTSEHLTANYTNAEGWSFNSVTALHKTKYEAIISPDYRDDEGVPNPFDVSGVVHLGGAGLTAASPTPSVAVPGYAGSPYLGYHLLFEQIVYDGSQELRVTSPQDKKLRGTLGANYYDYVTPGNDNYGLEPNLAGMGVAGNLSRSVTSTPAVFGGLYYDITSQLTISGEARYQWDRISSTTNFVAGGSPQPTLEATFTSFSPRIDIDYKFTPDQMLYALYSAGYKPGGFNSSIVGQTAVIAAQLAALGSQLTYQQEKLENWEGGLKSTWLDGKVRTAIDGYYDRWLNGQVGNSLSVQSGATLQMVTVTQNVGLVNMYGIEFTGGAAVTKNLTITGNYNYVHSDIRSYVYLPNGGRITAACAPQNGATCTIGKQFPNTPVGSTFALTPVYTDHLTGDWDWYSQLDWKHRGKYFIDATNIAYIGASDTLDLRFGIKDANKRLEAFVTNLTNNQTFTNGQVGADATAYAGAANVNEVRLILPQKRQFGVTATYNF